MRNCFFFLNWCGDLTSHTSLTFLLFRVLVTKVFIIHISIIFNYKKMMNEFFYEQMTPNVMDSD